MTRIRKENIRLTDYLKAIRIYHWPKNLLVFLPAITGHFITPESFSTLLVIFFSLSFVASGMYLMNDLLDIEWKDAEKNGGMTFMGKTIKGVTKTITKMQNSLLYNHTGNNK